MILRGLPRVFEVTAETIMDGKHAYQEAVSKLIVHETHPLESEGDLENAVLNQRYVKWCFTCGKLRHLAKRVRRLARGTSEISARGTHEESRGTLFETASQKRRMGRTVTIWKQRC